MGLLKNIGTYFWDNMLVLSDLYPMNSFLHLPSLRFLTQPFLEETFDTEFWQNTLFRL